MEIPHIGEKEYLSHKVHDFSARDPMGLYGGPRQLLCEPSPKPEIDLKSLHGLDPHLWLEKLHHTIPGRSFKDKLSKMKLSRINFPRIKLSRIKHHPLPGQPGPDQAPGVAEVFHGL